MSIDTPIGPTLACERRVAIPSARAEQWKARTRALFHFPSPTIHTTNHACGESDGYPGERPGRSPGGHPIPAVPGARSQGGATQQIGTFGYRRPSSWLVSQVGFRSKRLPSWQSAQSSPSWHSSIFTPVTA